MYCLVPEKPLRLFIPLIFSGGIWNFLLSHLALIQILFTKASIRTRSKIASPFDEPIHPPWMRSSSVDSPQTDRSGLAMRCFDIKKM
jgi:hypothetical protein